MSLIEESPDLRVAGLPKVQIPLTDCTERPRPDQADDTVGQWFELPARGLRSHRHGDDDSGRVAFAKSLDRGPHRRTRREAVVDQDHRATRGIGGRPAVTKQALATLELGLFTRRRGPDQGHRHAQGLDDLWVQDKNPARGDGAHGKLLVAGQAQLADDQDVERCVKCSGHLERNRNPAAREPQHEDIGAAAVLEQVVGEPPTGLPAVAKQHRIFIPLRAHLGHRLPCTNSDVGVGGELARYPVARLWKYQRADFLKPDIGDESWTYGEHRTEGQMGSDHLSAFHRPCLSGRLVK